MPKFEIIQSDTIEINTAIDCIIYNILTKEGTERIKMAQLQRISLKAQVYEIIRQKILNQEYALGEKLNIDIIAEELTISNSPIREALMMLSQDGLIELVPNNGAKVVSFSEQSYHEIASSLYVILYGAYDLCMRLGTIEEVAQKMANYLQQQQAYFDAGNIPESVKFALQFDKCIVTGTNNSYLLSLYERIEDVFYLMALYNHQRGAEDRHNNILEHKMILESIQNHDSEQLHYWLGVHYDKHL